MPDSHDERPYLAEWWPRVGATLLDLVVVWALLIAVTIAAEITIGPLGGIGSLWLLIWALLASAYTCLTMARKGRSNGQTLGKQAAGIP